MNLLHPNEIRHNAVGDDETPGPTKALKRVRGGFVFTLTTYNLVIVSGILLACMYNMRANSIFSCQAGKYNPDRFVADCSVPAYGEYEHGAYWFDLEPSAVNSAATADVLFLGSSRLQFAFSTAAADSWFSSAGISYYLLGFAQYENAIFTKPLLRKIRPRAAVYVIDVNGFFDDYESPAAGTVMRDETAGLRYKVKALWQRAHKAICVRVRQICGHQQVIFRSRKTGAYAAEDRPWGPSQPVSDDQKFDQSEITKKLPSAKDFLSGLPVRRECIILTMIPTGDTVWDYATRKVRFVGGKSGFSNALAIELGMTLVSPHLDGIRTYDGWHLDYESAERWSKAFLQEAAPQIRQCIGKPLTPP
jgi:hypothetical protein